MPLHRPLLLHKVKIAAALPLAPSPDKATLVVWGNRQKEKLRSQLPLAAWQWAQIESVPSRREEFSGPGGTIECPSSRGRKPLPQRPG